MSTTIRFHLDENVHSGIAGGLRSFGIDVTTTSDAGLVEADDAAQLAYCHTEGRVLVTHDRDFLSLDAAGKEHAGICYCHQDKYTLGQHLQMLVLVCECYDAQEFIGRVEYL